MTKKSEKLYLFAHSLPWQQERRLDSKAIINARGGGGGGVKKIRGLF